jgi:diadenylate cyclase
VWETLQSFGLLGLAEVLILAGGYYYVLLFLRGTRGAQVLVGFVLLLAALVGLTYFLHLTELNWLLRKLSVYLAIALLVIFQPEIRRALAELGRQPVLVLRQETASIIDQMVHAFVYLAEHRIGALVAIEREIGMRTVIETGTVVDAAVASDLLTTIFHPRTPLHDGGVIVQDGRLAAAGCIFPLSQNSELHRSLGTRHRAAIGISEETDAVAIAVSEETGTISVCYRGRITSGLDGERLRRFLAALMREKRGDSAWRRMQEQLDLTPGGIAKSENMSEKDGGASD